MKKRILSLALSIAMCISMMSGFAPLANAETLFGDISNDEWYYGAVTYAYENDLMVGFPDNNFYPHRQLTRAEFVTVLGNMHGIDRRKYGYNESIFVDVDLDSWYVSSVEWAVQEGIVNGYPDGTFRASTPVTREEMATLISRYVNLVGIILTDQNTAVSSFKDNSKISNWAVDSIELMRKSGIIQGFDDGNFNPQNGTRRAEAAILFMRLNSFRNADGKFDVIFDSTNMTLLDEENSIYMVETELQALSGRIVNAGSISKINLQISVGGLSLVDEELATSIWSFDNPPLLLGRNDVTVNVTDVDGKVQSKKIILFSESEINAQLAQLDEADDDGDGLANYIEDIYGTAKDNADTDSDGLNDYDEIIILGTNPLKQDSDDNGIIDFDEDADADTLTNGYELSNGLDPMFSDTDMDGLSDSEELSVYLTNPTNPDTDNDGATDGWEIENGFDPLVANATFDVVMTSETTGQNSVSVQLQLTGEQAETLSINEVPNGDLLTSNIPGFLTSAVDLSVVGDFNSALISFEFDPSYLTDPNCVPTIYYYDETTQLLESVSTTVVGNVATATITHFSKYILLNKKSFDEVWAQEFEPEKVATDTSLDVVLVIDSSGSMDDNDPNGLRHDAAKNFVDKLGTNDRAAIVDFDSYAALFQGFTNDHSLLYTAIDRVNYDGGTNLSSGISLAIDQFTDPDYSSDAMRYIIMLTDGDGSYNTSYTTKALENNIVIYTIGLGSGVRPAVLQAIADGTGGKYLFADEASDLLPIYEGVADEIDTALDANKDGIPDGIMQLLCDGKITTGTGTNPFEGVTYEEIQANADYDGDGLINGDEVIVTVTADGKYYIKFISSPVRSDTDGDGYIDSLDNNVLKWDISDRDLAICAGIVYNDIPIGTKLGDLSSDSGWGKIINSNEYNFVGTRNSPAAFVQELKGWSVLDTWYAIGLQAAAYKKDDNIIIAYRGSEDLGEWSSKEFYFDWLIADGLGWITGFNAQTPAAKSFTSKVMKANRNYNIYITGHSLGGNLAYNAASKAIDYNNKAVVKVATFNGLGFLSGLIPTGAFEIVDEWRLLHQSNKVINYKIDNDPVYKIPSTVHYGSVRQFDMSTGAPAPHSLYSFYKQLEPLNRIK